ncbi:transposable element Tcb1 transposase [Trichonephila clavipes]|uniref:Transposable element Tcb1 transposase n=1 Tax=Trichonephila clavipes TaxID=2585209 RepID=A0A8X6SKV1_TRICX|nr:transposable element Tcb1 transposase [Trichonephila clavipes]
MQEGTMDRRVRSHPPQSTTSCEDSQIVRMAVTDRSVPSRTVAQQIESVGHHLMPVCTIRRRLQQLPVLGLPLTQTSRVDYYSRFHHQGCDERRMWVAEWNEVVFTDESRVCLQHHKGRIQVWRQDAEELRYAPAHWSCTGYYGMGMYWISLSHFSSTHCWYFKQPGLHLRGVRACCPSLPSGLGHSHISTG